MSLAPVRLDDLDWRSMVDTIRRRIPAASSGDWTLHSPVDPGISLLELYAWLIDQRIFWVDQVPDSMIRASLRLLGVRPHGARAARTLLQIRLPGTAPAPFLLPRYSQFLLDDSRPDIRFTTTQATLSLPVADDGVSATTLFHGRARQLDATRALPLFGGDGSAGEVRFDFRLDAAPPAAFAAPFGVFLDLEVSSKIAPAWHPADARGAPAAAVLRWWYSAGGARRELDSSQLLDDTLGLRRPGLIRFRPPATAPWAERDPVNAPSSYSIWATVERGSFAYAPRLLRVVPSVAVAEHRRAVTLGPMRTDILPLPDRTVPLTLDARRNRDGDGPLSKQSQVLLRERDGAWHRWLATDDFTFHRGGSRVFVLDRGRQTLNFGDGYQGRVPALAAGDNLRWRIWMGGGMRGNVGAGRGWSVDAAGPACPCATATNVVAGVGGAEAESIDAVRSRARAYSQRVTRAVTAKDFEELSRAAPGVDVARAHAAVGAHPLHACPVADAVSVFIVPWAPRGTAVPADEFVPAPLADPGMLAAVRKRLERARLLGTQVFVRPAIYRAVDLHVDVSGERGNATAVQAVLFGSLREFLDPLSGGDGDPAAGWGFGAPLRPSLLLRRAQLALGPGLTATRVLISLEGSAGEDCQDVSPGKYTLPWLRSLTATVTPAPLSGGLR